MCLFCKIVAREIPSEVVLEDENFLCFKDINPVAKVHMVVVPKQHIKSFAQISSEVMSNMTIFIQTLSKKLGLDKNGYRVITNIGSDGGQEIKHLHFHILGGEKLTHIYKR